MLAQDIHLVQPLRLAAIIFGQVKRSVFWTEVRQARREHYALGAVSIPDINKNIVVLIEGKSTSANPHHIVFQSLTFVFLLQ